MKKAFYFLIRIHLKLRQKIRTYEESILFSYYISHLGIYIIEGGEVT
jgi:hypothetical protein